MKINLEEARRIEDTHGLFCQYCGETEPENGFYPVGTWHTGALSSWLCNDCDQRIRKNINVSDNVETKESLTNQKPWFNGMKTFSSVKVNPAPIEEAFIPHFEATPVEDSPPPLGINVVDSIASGDKIG